MNKDVPVAGFDFRQTDFGGYTPVSVYSKLPEIFGSSHIKEWIEFRRNARHRREIGRILRKLGLTDQKNFIDSTLGLSLTDTLWVKDENSSLKWKDVNLYENPLDKNLSYAAFSGDTSLLKNPCPAPEFNTDGMLEKCWIRDDNKLFLIKGGSGFEPYSEFFVTQLEAALDIPHISYTVGGFDGGFVSSCEIITSPDRSMFPASSVMHRGADIWEFLSAAEKLGFADKLRDILILDALTCNYDRHLHNIQFTADPESFEITGLAPAFDNGMALCSMCMSNDIDDLIDFSEDHSPFLYRSFNDFIPELITERMYLKLKEIQDFAFVNDDVFPLPADRFNALNEFISHRIYVILHLAERGFRSDRITAAYAKSQA